MSKNSESLLKMNSKKLLFENEAYASLVSELESHIDTLEQESSNMYIQSQSDKEMLYNLNLNTNKLHVSELTFKKEIDFLKEKLQSSHTKNAVKIETETSL